MKDAQPVILGFDTSTSACRVAVLRGDQLLAAHSEDMTRGQAERLMVLCQEVLAECELHTSDLSAVGVGIGPGNFTGIRISVAAARGLALGLGIPAIGVSAFEALRFGIQGPCACAVDARRGQIYLQTFDDKGASKEPMLCTTDTLPSFEGPLIGQGDQDPHYPQAVSICHIAGTKLRSHKPRPAPLYIRPADAAPARDTPPNRLT